MPPAQTGAAERGHAAARRSSPRRSKEAPRHAARRVRPGRLSARRTGAKCGCASRGRRRRTLGRSRLTGSGAAVVCQRRGGLVDHHHGQFRAGHRPTPGIRYRPRRCESSGRAPGTLAGRGRRPRPPIRTLQRHYRQVQTAPDPGRPPLLRRHAHCGSGRRRGPHQIHLHMEVGDEPFLDRHAQDAGRTLHREPLAGGQPVAAQGQHPLSRSERRLHQDLGALAGEILVVVRDERDRLAVARNSPPGATRHLPSASTGFGGRRPAASKTVAVTRYRPARGVSNEQDAYGVRTSPPPALGAGAAVVATVRSCTSRSTSRHAPPRCSHARRAARNTAPCPATASPFRWSDHGNLHDEWLATQYEVAATAQADVAVGMNRQVGASAGRRSAAIEDRCSGVDA